MGAQSLKQPAERAAGDRRARRLPPDQRREQIIAAVTRVVAEHGVPEATVSRIAEAADAHRRMESGAHVGKIVLTVGG